jgi:hypothetical protein
MRPGANGGRARGLLPGSSEQWGLAGGSALWFVSGIVQWLKEHVSGTDAELGQHLARRTA